VALAKLVSVSLAELEAPLPDSFVSYFNSPPGHHYFDLTITEGKVEIQPDTFLNNLAWITMTFVGRGSLNFVGVGQFGLQVEGGSL
jgi:hypothetical protein